MKAPFIFFLGVLFSGVVQLSLVYVFGWPL